MYGKDFANKKRGKSRSPFITVFDGSVRMTKHHRAEVFLEEVNDQGERAL